MRIGLVGCVKTKWIHPAPAQDLYISTLFKGRRKYVENSCDRWFVLSAKHGLVNPSEVIEPYDVALTEKSNTYRVDWSRQVVKQIQDELGELFDVTFEIHAGAAYRNYGLLEGLLDLGARVEVPTGDQRLGKLLSFYSDENPHIDLMTSKPGKPASHLPKVKRSRNGYEAIGEYLSTIKGDAVLLTFEEIEYLISGSLPRSASTYGVWWANSETNPQSRGWVPYGWKVHRIKVEEREVRFLRVGAKSIRQTPESKPLAPDVRNFLRLAESILEHKIPPERINTKPLNPKLIVETMLEYGARLEEQSRSQGVSYTPNPVANEFLLTDPFAFLIGVIFDQGIPAERAWAAPYELKQRLGHLDPLRLMNDGDSVLVAVQDPPKLHRFINNVPEWITLASAQVVGKYQGNAANIWNDNPTAIELLHRLTQFKGIGQKKAAMAVELLARDLGVEIRELQGGDVAYDVHIRRVFLRTGLSILDNVDEIVNSGRENNPDRPGSLDGPAWNIGRNWCRPTYPACPACVLEEVCPKFISRASSVKGN